LHTVWIANEVYNNIYPEGRSGDSKDWQ